MDNLKSACGYCRFSSNRQQELSIEAQQRAINEYCQKNGFVIEKWFLDRAQSGQTADRPEFQKLLEAVSSPKCPFKAVIIHKLDRFSRNTVDTFIFREMFAEHNVELISTEEDLSGDEFMFGINVLLNQRYVRNLSKEVMKGLKERAYKALFNGGKPPLGYYIKDGKYVIDEQEAIIVKTVFELSAEGYGYKSIIEKLNEKGYKTKNNNTFGKNSLYDLLRNEKYKGVYTFNKAAKRNTNRKRNSHKKKSEDEIIRIENAVPAIVSEELWERANASRKLSSKLSTNAKYEYLLSGLVYCGECGAKMHGNRRCRDSGYYNTYRCNKQSNQFTCTCSEIRAEYLERFVIESLTQHFFSDGVVDIIVQQVNEEIAEINKNDNVDILSIKNALNGLQFARNNLIDALAKTGYNEAISDRLNSIELQISNHQKTIDDYEKNKKMFSVTPEQVKKKIATLKKELLNTEDVERKRILLHSYIEKIVVDNNKVKVTFKVAFSFCIDGETVEICYNHIAEELRNRLQKTT